MGKVRRNVWIALCVYLFVAESASAQYVLSGRVYRGEHLAEPPGATGLAGVTVRLYGSGDAGTLGAEIDSYTTVDDGWYGVDTLAQYEYFTIVCEGKSGYVFQGSFSAGGMASDEQIQYALPLEVKTLTGNKFWYLPEETPPENQPPVVDAGPDQVYGTPEPVTLPHMVALSGSATDDGLPAGELGTEWMLVSGPSEVEFVNMHDLHTTVALPAYGTYVLRLVAGDGEYESSDDVQIEVVGETEPCGCLLAQDLDRNSIVDFRDLAMFVSAWLSSTPECPAEAVARPQGSGRQIASVLIPTYMYYLERYFTDVPDKTELDMQIKEILDESPAGREFLLGVLANYKETPPQTKEMVYDAETVAATAVADEPLNLDLIRERVSQLAPDLAWGLGGTPAAPTSLTATDTSAWDQEFPRYEITLTWQDNSNDEDGFRIYRISKPVGAPAAITSKLLLHDLVGSNVTTYRDQLSKPADPKDQYCYQVVAYKVSMVTLVGQPPAIVESDPSNGVCAYYDTSPPPPATDTDGDGVPDFLDDCPNLAGVLTHGCPDADLDDIPNIVEGAGVLTDMCPSEKGKPQGKYIPADRHGCPQRYKLRWMKMEVKNNTGVYTYPQFNFGPPYKGLYDNEVYNDNNQGGGEEPYLLFSFVNGQLQGMPLAWTSKWCCGNGIDVKQGQKLVEPAANGLTILPGTGNEFAPIDAKLGLNMTVSLMERDYDITVVQDEADALTAAIAIGGKVAGAIGGCVGSGGFGCLASIGAALKGVIEDVLGLSKKPTTVTVGDPDDFQGADSWGITAMDAYSSTASDGAYGFYMDMPTTVWKSCLGWTPCPPGAGVPITMQVRVYFCMYREGISEGDIKKVCSPYVWVSPVK